MPQVSDISAIETNFMGVAHLLRDRQLEVPPYQRSYSWGKDEVQAFWSDLRAALISEQNVYFLGTVVLTAGTSGLSTIIDGQQRLATTSMLLAAIRDAFAEKGDAASAAQVNSQDVSSTSLLTQQSEPRVRLNINDRAPYQAVVVSAQSFDTSDFSESGKRLAAGFGYLKQWLRDDVEAAGPYWRQRLLDWIQMLDLRSRIIVVSVRDDADAFMIFETLNDRGLALTVADLVKNYLFGLCRDRISQAEDLWLSAVSSFEYQADSLDFTTFLRQWWTSLHGATRERDLYRRIRFGVSTQTAALQAITQISEAAPRYIAILNPQDEYWTDHPEASVRAVKVLGELGLEQHRPLLLAAMSQFHKGELEVLLRSLVSWSVRGLIVGGFGGGTTERYYAEAAVAVSEGRAMDVQQVANLLDPIVPSDRAFSSAFAVRRIYKTGLTQYYLKAIDSWNSLPDVLNQEKSLVPVVTKSDLSSFDWAEHEEPIDRRIGNYVIVSRDEAQLLRSSLEDRLDMVGTDVRSIREWVLNGVDVRQERMAEAAVRIWPKEPS